MQYFLFPISPNGLSPSKANHILESVLGDRYEAIAKSLIAKLEPAMDNVRKRNDSSLSLTPDETLLLYLWAKLGSGAVIAVDISESLSKLLSTKKNKPEENPSR